ncbi:MAG: adenosylcobinamide-GDP ribazoletransferase [Gammaproteobacteria bacterium]|nr:adenosylcobinamide-GDP ribazoletransferase [Gammaproteobacteria bacterium]
MRRVARNELQAFALALQFLTRLPGPADDAFSPERLAASVRYYPLVGALIGGLCAAVFWPANLVLPAAVAVILAVAVGLAITGALHEDGLADTFDGIGIAAGRRGSPGTGESAGKHAGDTPRGSADGHPGEPGRTHRHRMLEVMRDSRLGTFGAIALVIALALKVATLASLAPIAVCLALIAGHGLSRLSCIAVMQTSAYVRTAGIATPLANRLEFGSWLVILVTGLLVVAGLFRTLGPPATILALAGLIAGHALMRLCFERKLGGYTGDTLGAVQQASEVGLYLGVCAGAGAWA